MFCHFSPTCPINGRPFCLTSRTKDCWVHWTSGKTPAKVEKDASELSGGHISLGVKATPFHQVTAFHWGLTIIFCLQYPLLPTFPASWRQGWEIQTGSPGIGKWSNVKQRNENRLWGVGIDSGECFHKLRKQMQEKCCTRQKKNPEGHLREMF